MIGRDAENRYRRNRYASDPDYRQRLLDAQKAEREQRNQRRKDRYRFDDEYRAKQIRLQREYQQRKRAFSAVGLSPTNPEIVLNKGSV